MAVSSNITLVEDVEGTLGTITSFGGGTPGSANTDIFIEANQSIGRRTDNATLHGYLLNAGATFNLSAIREHYGCWQWITHRALLTELRVVFGSSTSDYDEHTVPLAQYPETGGWIFTWVDVTRTPENNSGTIDKTIIDEVGQRASIGNVGGNAQNNIMDAVYHAITGNGLLWDGSTGSFADFVTFDETNREGVIIEINGVRFVQARLEIGSGTATTFTDTGSTLFFIDQSLVDEDWMGITIDLQNASNNIDFIDGSIRSVNPSGKRGDLIVLNTSGAFDTDNCVFGGLRRIKLNSACTFVTTQVVESGQIDPTNGDYSGEVDLPGTDEYVDTQENIDLSSTSGDFELFLHVEADDWTPAAGYTLAAHYGGTIATESFRLTLISTGALRLIVSDGSAETTLDSSALTVNDGFPRWLRVRYDQSAGQADFFESRDPVDTPLGDISWTAAGTPSGTSRSIPSLSRPMLLGAQNDSSPATFFNGRIQFAELWTDGERDPGGTLGDLIFRADWRIGPDFSASTRADDFDSALTWELQGTSPTYTTADNNSGAADLDGTRIADSSSEAALLWNVNTDPNGELDNIDFTSAGTGHAIEFGPNTPATITLTGQSYTGYAGSDGSTGNEVIYNNSNKAITINISGGGDTPTIRNGTGASTTVVNTVTLTVTSQDKSAVAIPYTKVRIEETDGTLITAGISNDQGVFTDSTYNYVSDTNVNIIVRKNSPGEVRYIDVDQPGQITSSGLNTTIAMTQDTIAGNVPPVGILRQGTTSEDESGNAVITAEIDVPDKGTSRKLLVGAFYWDSSTDLTVSAATYDGNAMTAIAGGSISEQEGAGNFHELFLYRHDIPDADSGRKTISITFSANVAIKAISFAIIDDVATGAEDNAGSNSGDQDTGNPSVSLNNSAAAWSVVFSMVDDTDSPTPTGVAVLRRSDVSVDELKMLAVLTANRTATGAHSLGADYGSNSKTWVSGGATFLKN